jgi:hypothetical protein
VIPASWEVAGSAQLAAAWEREPEITRQRFEQFMHGATLYVEGEIKERTPHAFGTLRESFSSQVTSAADNVIGVVGSPLNYAVPVELGTKPHFPPVAAIQEWVEQKMALRGPEARSVAYLIARKIAVRGTKGAFMVQHAFEAAKPELERQAQATLQAIVDELAKAGRL